MDGSSVMGWIDERQNDGTFDLIVKTYYPTEKDPGGTIGNILDTIRIGEKVRDKRE